MITVGEFIKAIQYEADLADVDIMNAELLGIGSSTNNISMYHVNLKLKDDQKYSVNIPKRKVDYERKFNDDIS